MVLFVCTHHEDKVIVLYVTVHSTVDNILCLDVHHVTCQWYDRLSALSGAVVALQISRIIISSSNIIIMYTRHHDNFASLLTQNLYAFQSVSHAETKTI